MQVGCAGMRFIYQQYVYVLYIHIIYKEILKIVIFVPGRQLEKIVFVLCRQLENVGISTEIFFYCWDARMLLRYNCSIIISHI